MRVLIVGNGGREAAIAREVLKSPLLTKMYMTPQNDFYLGKINFLDISLKDHAAVLNKIKEQKIDLVIVGPELPLVDGLSDFLRKNEVLVFGPSQKGAMLEGSKVFCKEFLVRAGIPTGQYVECTSYEDILEKSQKFTAPWILKGDGLAAGKGVYICADGEELERAARELVVEKKLGQMKVFLEENLPGKELSFLTLTNGKDFQCLPVAQDHKRIFDNDVGPNTGGMGAVAPVEISKDLKTKIEDKVVKPFLLQLEKEDIDYRGVIYFGIMVIGAEPFVLEINARFGDPEAQVLLPLLDSDWLEVFLKVAKKEKLPELKWKNKNSVCVVMAAPGYPDSPEKNIPIVGDIFNDAKDSYFIAAGIKKSDTHFVTTGGRVLNAIALAETATEALDKANQKAQELEWKGLQKRSDIGLKVLNKDKFIF